MACPRSARPAGGGGRVAARAPGFARQGTGAHTPPAPIDIPIPKRLFIRTVRSAEVEWLDVIGVVEHQRHIDLTSATREACW